MTIFNFGVGTLVGRRTDISNPTPVIFGVLQSVDLSIDATNKMLYGQNQIPVDVARGELKIGIKAKFARIKANTFNDLFFGLTTTPLSGEQMAVSEAHTISGTSQTITPPSSGVFAADMGVSYAATGLQLARGPTASATGVYSVNEATGIYTFAAGDTGAAVVFNYRYTLATLNEITLTNQLMGFSPTFEVNLQENYTNNGGTAGTTFLRLTACKSSKLGLNFKNNDYTVPEFDFDCFANSAGTWGVLTFNEA